MPDSKCDAEKIKPALHAWIKSLVDQETTLCGHGNAVLGILEIMAVAIDRNEVRELFFHVATYSQNADVRASARKAYDEFANGLGSLADRLGAELKTRREPETDWPEEIDVN